MNGTGRTFTPTPSIPSNCGCEPLGEGALEQVRAPELPPALADPQGPLPPACPVPTARLDSLWECFHKQMTDPRDPRGVRHKLAGFLTLIALAVAAGCKGPHAIAEFAQSLNHAQRRRLRCRPRPGRPREYDVPCGANLPTLAQKGRFRTTQRRAGGLDGKPKIRLRSRSCMWTARWSRTPNRLRPVPPPSRPRPPPPSPAKSRAELQKPKADKALMLVNFQTTEQRLVDQVAVPRDTNEEAAVAAHLPKMDLAGVCLTADAAHTIKANCRQLTQGNGAEFFLFLKANQPLALAKAEQLLPGTLPPSGQHAGQRPRTH